MSDGHAAGLTSQLVIANMKPDTMHLLVAWMYGTARDLLTFQQAVELYAASDRYGMTSLHQACIHQIIYHHLRLPRNQCAAPEVINPHVRILRPSKLVYELWIIADAMGSGAVVQVRRPALLVCSVYRSERALSQKCLFMPAHTCSMLQLCYLLLLGSHLSAYKLH